MKTKTLTKLLQDKLNIAATKALGEVVREIIRRFKQLYKAQYFNLSTDQPADGQRVWLKIQGAGRPVFAIYNAKRFKYFETDTETHYPGNYPDKEDTWTPAKAPGELKSTRRFLEHKGYDDHRLSDNLRNESEITLAHHWVKRNTDNGKYGFLKYLIPEPTQRDAKVAATIIQWLGTNIGLAFLSEAVRESTQLSNFLSRAVGYKKRVDTRLNAEKLRTKVRAVLSYMEKHNPEVVNAEPGSDEMNILLICNDLRTRYQLPWLDPKRDRING